MCCLLGKCIVEPELVRDNDIMIDHVDREFTLDLCFFFLKYNEPLFTENSLYLQGSTCDQCV